MSTLDLAVLNSATKYPSIPTYHALGDRGALTEEAVEFHGTVVLTEKVDGTNGRIVQLPGGDWFIGSREELLTARGDRISNPALGIVDALRALAESLAPVNDGLVSVLYLEVYGHKIGGAAKQYTGSGQVGYRLFDVAAIPTYVLGLSREEVSAWRDGGGQVFASEELLAEIARSEGIPLVPRLGAVSAAEGLPKSVEGMHAFLSSQLPTTNVALDETALGRPEGIVLRTTGRSVIAKARFEDYERTLKRRAQAGRGR
jgi:hypothetical protein